MSYDFHYGETDLQEQTLSGAGNRYTLVGIVFLLVLIAGIVGIFIGSQFLSSEVGGANSQPEAIIQTARPTLNIATVTEGPPTATASWTPSPSFTPSNTPTREPCIQRIPTGGSLIGAITSCGYTSLEIMPTVMALNNISDAASIQVGQEIVIPWPSSTPDPNAIPTATNTPESNAGVSDQLTVLEIDTSIDPFAPTATATLPPGVMWHEVQADENIIVIALQYNANAKVLSELNPQKDFARCEFGERFGGPECIVPLFQGELLRVPAPTPTPTLSPTTDPNATATPTPTPTYNEPSPSTPADRAFFGVDELITLRWIPSGILGSDEQYRVDVVDQTSGRAYTAYTTEISFIIPGAWQGQDTNRHEFEWTVGVVDEDTPDNVRFRTSPRVFFWQGLDRE